MVEVETLSGVREVPAAEWNALVADGSPFLEWEWLASLEDAGCVGGSSGWTPRPLVVRDAGRLVAAVPLYVKTHSEGEFVFDWGWADAAQRAGIPYYPKLLVGVPFTPVGGTRFLVAPGERRAEWLDRLGGALVELCRDNDLSGVHVNFCREDEIEPLRARGFELRIGVQYHWRNGGYASVDDWLGRFRSKRRNQIRRERREVADSGVVVRALAGREIPDELFEPMFRFYLRTVRERVWGRQYLNRKFFGLLRERFRERLCFVVAQLGGEPIAGTFNVVKGDALYGRYWGALREVRNLHFEVCYYAAVEHCIARGLARFEPGAGGDYKQARGFDGQPTYSLHWLAEPRLRAAVARFLAEERAHTESGIDWLREHSALKPD
ncbi:MAG TPA: GNAT family N-acetyltransferase [Myxococcota bacterium]|nr:GNAT family N-acetyltransferase [Myxococcota bacterium]